MSEGFIAADYKRYPRDLSGYGANKPQANWPDGARIALQFVIMKALDKFLKRSFADRFP